MTERRSPVDQLLDLLVYAPVGLALAVRDELPRLVEKGRSQTDSQVALARMLGQMAAGKGQQEIGKMLNEVWARVSGGGDAKAEPSAPTPATPATPTAGGRSAAPAPDPPAPPSGSSADELAIPGYDSLSASQVVQRLSGLSPEELEAVRAYESNTRHRQTILGRITQLQSARPDMESARHATLADLPELVRLSREAIAELGAQERGGAVFAAREARPEPLEDGLRLTVQDSEQVAVVGAIDDATVGMASGHLEKLRDGRILGVLDDLYVHPEARSVGVGEAMMNELLEWFAAHGCSGVDAVALPGMRGTKNFFEECGFTARLLVMHHRMESRVSEPSLAPQVCVGAVAVDADRLLLVRRGQGPAAGTWSIPGGRVEPGEALAEAVVREVAEETRLEVVCDAFLGWVERIGEGWHHVILDFSVTPLEAKEPRAGGDATEAAWVPLSEVSDLRLVDGLAEFLHDHGILRVYA